MTEILDESHFISKERAIRGAKYGLIIGTGASLAYLSFALTSNPDPQAKYIADPDSFVILSFIKETAIVSGFLGAYGAINDGIRPLAKFHQIEIDNLLEFKKRITSFYNFVDNIGDKRIGLAISGLGGAFMGGVFSGSAALMRTINFGVLELQNQFLSPIPSDYPLSFLADHPIEAIAVGAVIGASITASKLAFHR